MGRPVRSLQFFQTNVLTTMKFDPEKHHRRSIRLKGYNYNQPGWYFVTIVVQGRRNILGEIVDGKINLNNFGHIVKNEWITTDKLRRNIELDEFIIMPNHLHGIIHITDDNPGKGTEHRALTDNPQSIEKFGKPVSGSIPTIIRSFKAAVTSKINQLHKSPGMRLWQRNYWERVIRDEDELNGIRKYIIENPLKWQEDTYL